MATRVWNMKPLGWGKYWEAVCAVREGGKRDHARRRMRRRCRTMTDSFLAGTICHTDIGRKIGERSSGGAVGVRGGGQRVQVAAALKPTRGGREGERGKLLGPPQPRPSTKRHRLLAAA